MCLLLECEFAFWLEHNSVLFDLLGLWRGLRNVIIESWFLHNN